MRLPAAPRILLAAALLALVFVPGADGHSYTHGAISVGHVWAPPQPDTERGAVVFGVIVNRGDRPAALVGVSTPAAQSAHLRVSKDGEPHLIDSIELPPGRPYALAPWSGHIWLEGLKGPVTVGDRIPLSLDFGPAGTLAVEAMVEDSPSE